MESNRGHSPGVLFLVVLTVGFVLAVTGLVVGRAEGSRTVAGGASLVDGSLTAGVDAAIERHHPLRDAAISVLAAGRYLLFREAMGEAVVGADGWLFTLEEFERHPDDRVRLDERLTEIEATGARLRERGIDLAVILVPAKARLYADKLPSRWRALADHPRYDDAVERLRAAGVTVVDLRDAFATNRPSARPLFYARDTHWTPLGARVAADAVGAALHAAGMKAAADGVSYARSANGTVEVDGDLMSFVPAGAFRALLGLQEETAAVYELEEEGGSLGLFDELTIPVALVGTSYSRDERWGFADALKVALQADVLNVAAEGQGPFEPMRSYIAGETIVDTPPERVIWEIPERYLTIP